MNIKKQLPNIDLSRDLKTLLEREGLTQKEFEEITGISQSIVSKVLNGKGIRLSTFLKFWPYVYGGKSLKR